MIEGTRLSGEDACVVNVSPNEYFERYISDGGTYVIERNWARDLFVLLDRECE